MACALPCSDSCNPQGPMFVNIYIFFNQLYNLLIILILKYGSSNILYMALTMMVRSTLYAFYRAPRCLRTQLTYRPHVVSYNLKPLLRFRLETLLLLCPLFLSTVPSPRLT